MTTITIPKEIAKKGDLVLLPREEYEEFARWKKLFKSFKVFTPTATEKKDLREARKDYRAGRYLTLNELKRKLEVKN